MAIPEYFSAPLFLYFAVLGSIALVLVALLFWTWMRMLKHSNGRFRSGLTWSAWGYVFMLSAAWFACGVGAGPGFLLASDPSVHQPFLATAAAVAGMFCSVVGWACLLLGQRQILRGLEEGELGVRHVSGAADSAADV